MLNIQHHSANIAENSKHNRYQGSFVSEAYKFFDEKPTPYLRTRINSNSDSQNKQLAEELHKPINRKFEKVSSFQNKIWGADLADMQLINRCNKGIRFLLCVTNVFNKYKRVVFL